MTTADRPSGGGAAGRHYQIPVDVASESSHAKVLRKVGSGHDVLELGCAAGSVTQHLADQGNGVTAVEVDPAAAARASEFAEVIVANLDSADLGELLAGRTFDRVIAADVLEHLVRPERVLESVHSLLRPGGRLIASIPNIAHGSVRLALLAGRWEYQPWGLLDQTHVRFFTRASIEQMLERTGYRVESIEPVTVPIASTSSGVEWTLDQVPSAVVEWLNSEPGATDHQYVVVAESQRRGATPPSRAASPDSEAATVARQQARMLREAEASIHELNRRIVEIESSRSYGISHWIGMRRAALSRRIANRRG